MNDTSLEVRMYFFVPYNISSIQKSIQAGHSALRYALSYGRRDPEHIIWDFIEKHETWVILNGGTTNKERDANLIPVGTLNQIGDYLNKNEIEFSFFHEPDLNNALTAICFLVDERAFNKDKYPDFEDWFNPEADRSEILLDWCERLSVTHASQTIIDLFNEWYSEDTQYKKRYEEWFDLVGGAKNVKLREILKDKKLA